MYYEERLEFTPEEVLIYLRKSRSDDPLLTVEEVLMKHEKMLDEWAEKYLGGKIPAQNRFREVVSGETIENRPEIQRILHLIESPKYKAILVIEVQRLSRGDLEDAGRLMKLLRYTNTAVITPQKTYDLRNEFDRDYFERELKRGNEFLEYTKKIMLRGRLASVKDGNFIGSIPPYGYDKVIVQEGKRKCPTLRINETEAEAVRMIFDLYVNEGLGYTKIAQRLNKLGYKPRNGSIWSRESVQGLLSNEHYIGQVRWNWRKTLTIVEDGELSATRPKNRVGEYLVFEGKHTPIVSRELFFAARERLNNNPRAKSKTELRNPLAGLVYCRCGRAMSLRTYKRKGKPVAPRLICDNQQHCGTSSCTYEEFLNRVAQILAQCIEDFEVRVQESSEDSVKLHAQLISQLEARLKELERKEMSQWEKYSEEAMPKEIFEKLNAKVLKEKAEVSQALCDARDSMPDPVDYEERLHRFQEALAAITDPNVPAKKKNMLLKACIEKIVYYREKAERVKRAEGEKKGERFKSAGGRWTTPSIELEVTLHL